LPSILRSEGSGDEQGPHQNRGDDRSAPKQRANLKDRELYRDKEVRVSSVTSFKKKMFHLSTTIAHQHYSPGYGTHDKKAAI
jgi:hypothetical protein